jgi:orotate phosphoribosyltransferase
MTTNQKLASQIGRTMLINVIKERMVTREDGITCSGGEATTTYLDIPGALRDKKALTLAIDVLFDHVNSWGLLYQTTAIGGPTTGAIPLVVGLAMHDGIEQDQEWFIVRDKPKSHGLGRSFVGGEPGPGDRVILTDDVVSTGGSMVETVKKVQATGAVVVAVVPLVDRAGAARDKIEALGVAYLPVLDYTDLDLPPLGV